METLHHVNLRVLQSHLLSHALQHIPADLIVELPNEDLGRIDYRHPLLKMAAHHLHNAAHAKPFEPNQDYSGARCITIVVQGSYKT